MQRRSLWVGTSWKMNKTIAESLAYVDGLNDLQIDPIVQPFVLPPLTSLAAVRDRLDADSPVLLGAQNAHWAAEGAGTGEVSMRMVKDAGADLVEIGHSERREQFGETDQTVALKMASAAQHDLIPLLCVGEPAAVRERGAAVDFVLAQVTAALEPLTAQQRRQVVIAYEPIWAIGVHGRAPVPGETAEVMRAIAELTGPGGITALLYGGSVTQDNAPGLLRDDETDGLFVGRAAWDIDGYAAILTQAAEHAKGG